jgi:hypothetical protein
MMFVLLLLSLHYLPHHFSQGHGPAWLKAATSLSSIVLHLHGPASKQQNHTKDST